MVFGRPAAVVWRPHYKSPVCMASFGNTCRGCGKTMEELLLGYDTSHRRKNARSSNKRGCMTMDEWEEQFAILKSCGKAKAKEIWLFSKKKCPRM